MNFDPKVRPGACAVYLMQHDGNGPFKVGIGVNPAQRLQNLQIGNPYLIEVRHCEWFPYELDAQEKERELHQILKAWNVRGEWFLSSPETVDALETHAPWATGVIRMKHEIVTTEHRLNKQAMAIAERMLPDAVIAAREAEIEEEPVKRAGDWGGD